MSTQAISGRAEIELLVNTFYARIREDDLLSPIFNEVIQQRWPEHLEKMYNFWETVLYATPAYKGSPFPKHARLPVEEEHFLRWQEIFNQTVDSLFIGEKAEEAKWRAGRMAELFLQKIRYFKANTNSFPL